MVSSAGPWSSERSMIHPRWPRIRPPRTWKTWTEASSSSVTRAKTSQSAETERTTADLSRTFCRAVSSSRRRAACS
ncbi:Uncharacterised protein [Mycobacteroides abscessus subsp. abscessus]|nr:Uncharacterised protein [Mycobacteroides abscessus subsp. abscessus]